MPISTALPCSVMSFLFLYVTWRRCCSSVGTVRALISGRSMPAGAREGMRAMRRRRERDARDAEKGATSNAIDTIWRSELCGSDISVLYYRTVPYRKL